VLCIGIYNTDIEYTDTALNVFAEKVCCSYVPLWTGVQIVRSSKGLE